MAKTIIRCPHSVCLLHPTAPLIEFCDICTLTIAISISISVSISTALGMGIVIAFAFALAGWKVW